MASKARRDAHKSVIEVFNLDGSTQSVWLVEQVRADDVVHAVARRQGVPDDRMSLFSLYQVLVWQEAPVDASGPQPGKAQTRVELKKLAPKDRPLTVRVQSEARVEEATRGGRAGPAVLNAVITFAFLDSQGEELFARHGADIVLRGLKDVGTASGGLVEESPKAQQGGGGKLHFAPINFLGRGNKCGFLFQRSAANPREWQRRWCILRKDELVHCLSNLDHSDAKYVRLTQNSVKAIPPKDLGGFKHCFEIDTPQDVLQFRARTDDEARGWVAAIQRNIELASENEKLHLAERMIEDGQRSLCSRDEAMLEKALGSLQGLLSTHAGADRLYRFAKRSSLGERGEREAELVAFFLDLCRAHTAFSALASEAGGQNCMAEAANCRLGQADVGKVRSTNSSVSLASSVSSSLAGAALRGSAATLSRKDWMSQICERLTALFEPAVQGAEGDPELFAVVRAAQSLRSELAEEATRVVPREACLVLIEEARTHVLKALEEGLYRRFVSAPEYKRVVATIPSRVNR